MHVADLDTERFTFELRFDRLRTEELAVRRADDTFSRAAVREESLLSNWDAPNWIIEGSRVRQIHYRQPASCFIKPGKQGGSRALTLLQTRLRIMAVGECIVADFGAQRDVGCAWCASARGGEVSLRRFGSVTLLGLGAILALLVACRTPPPPRDLPPAPGHGPLTTYTVTLRSFGDRDSHAIVRVMAEEFPGYQSHDLIDKVAADRTYEYRTTAKAYKLEEWLSILLHGMGFDLDLEVMVRVQGAAILVERRPPKSSDPAPGDDEPVPPRRDGSWAPVTGERFR